MMQDWLILFELSMLFVALFIAAEILYHVSNVRAEYTRKIVHTGTGALTLLFPVCFHHLWQVIVICTAFLILLTGSMRLGFLKSINAVNRKTSGSILYPVIVVLVFAFYMYVQHQPLIFDRLLYFYLPILLMAICDPIAALAGGWYKRSHPLSVGKTWAGSVSFLIVAFLLSLILYNIFSIQLSSVYVFLCAAVTAVITMLAERLSSKGWDNFTIPAVVVVFLYSIELIR